MPGDIANVDFTAMHRNPDIWGPDAGEFRPKRWANDKLRPRWGCLPFGGGPHFCAALALSRYWITYAPARILLRFERLENAETDEGKMDRLRFHMRFHISANHGLNIVLGPAT
jgi:cytochrome P450